MDIFISYASEQRAVAEEIALSLRGEGHQAFFDRAELPEGDAYNARIREAIRACDLLIFLVSPESVSEGRYTLTELRFAEERWRSPAGRVLPVMARPTDTAAIPASLRAVVSCARKRAGGQPPWIASRPRWVRSSAMRSPWWPCHGRGGVAPGADRELAQLYSAKPA
jgi:hypothetical protein